MASTKKSSKRKSLSLNRRQLYLMTKEFNFEKQDDVQQLAMWTRPANQALRMGTFYVIRGYFRGASNSNTCFPDDLIISVLRFYAFTTPNPSDRCDGCPESIFKLFRALSMVPHALPDQIQVVPDLTASYRAPRHMTKYKHHVIPLDEYFEHRPSLSVDMIKRYAILKLLQHKYVVRIDVEPVECKSLHNYVTRKKRLSEDRAREITTMLLEAIEFLHSRDVVHGNLSPLNVRLVDATDRSIIKVCFENHAANANTPYTAPEVIRSGHYAKLFTYRVCGTCHVRQDCSRLDKNSTMWCCSDCWPQKTPPPARDYRCFEFPVDVWAIGAITFRMLFGWDYQQVRNEYRGKGKYKAKFKQGIFDFLNKKKKSLGSVCVGFVDSLLENKPQDRPSAAKALLHPWIKTGYADTKEAHKRQRSPSPVYVRPRFSAK